jgi:7-keto-8-aminopelargonate synthetase-like enzyme
LTLVDQEPWRREQLWKRRQQFVTGLVQLGIDISCTETPIVPIIIGDAGSALSAAERLLDLGVYAPAIRPPSVPAGSARIRATVMATHSEEDIERAIG